MADISEITAGNASVEIKHPATGERIGLTIHLMHEDSKPLQDLQRKWQNEALKTRGRGLTAEKLEVRTLERLVTATAGWEWGEDENGEPCTFNGEQPEFSAANVRKVYKDMTWIKAQVADALTDEATFFRGAD